MADFRVRVWAWLLVLPFFLTTPAFPQAGALENLAKELEELLAREANEAEAIERTSEQLRLEWSDRAALAERELEAYKSLRDPFSDPARLRLAALDQELRAMETVEFDEIATLKEAGEQRRATAKTGILRHAIPTAVERGSAVVKPRELSNPLIPGLERDISALNAPRQWRFDSEALKATSIAPRVELGVNPFGRGQAAVRTGKNLSPSSSRDRVVHVDLLRMLEEEGPEALQHERAAQELLRKTLRAPTRATRRVDPERLAADRVQERLVRENAVTERLPHEDHRPAGQADAATSADSSGLVEHAEFGEYVQEHVEEGWDQLLDLAHHAHHALDAIPRSDDQGKDAREKE